MTASRLSRRLRRTVSLLLTAVLALSPVVSTAAQTHEAAHAAHGDEHFHEHDHGHDGREAGAAAAPGAVVHDDAGHADEMPDSGGVLHVLAHAAHACGHSVAILGAVLVAPMTGAHDVVLAAFDNTPADAPRAHPFRPPIG